MPSMWCASIWSLICVCCPSFPQTLHLYTLSCLPLSLVSSLLKVIRDLTFSSTPWNFSGKVVIRQRNCLLRYSWFYFKELKVANITLWALICLPSSHARAKLLNSLSFLNEPIAVLIFLWKNPTWDKTFQMYSLYGYGTSLDKLYDFLLCKIDQN